jgi:hypothetical protein
MLRLYLVHAHACSELAWLMRFSTIVLLLLLLTLFLLIMILLGLFPLPTASVI